jgi:hypothetical protein
MRTVVCVAVVFGIAWLATQVGGTAGWLLFVIGTAFAVCVFLGWQNGPKPAITAAAPAKPKSGGSGLAALFFSMQPPSGSSKIDQDDQILRYNGLRIGEKFSMPPQSFVGCKSMDTIKKLAHEQAFTNDEEAFKRLLSRSYVTGECITPRAGEVVHVTGSTFGEFKFRRAGSDVEYWTPKTFP